MTSGAYILKFSRPLGSSKHSARHYIGWSRNIEARIKDHQRGRGAAITRAARKQGITFEIALIIPNVGRDVEQQIKRYKNTERFIRAYNQRKTGAA